eukprot:1007144-Rhodomonas_salina.2
MIDVNFASVLPSHIPALHSAVVHAVATSLVFSTSAPYADMDIAWVHSTRPIAPYSTSVLDTA